MTSARPAPRLLVWVSWAVLAVGTVMVLVGAWRTGISTDEPYHVLRLDGWFAHGWYLLADDLDGGRPGSWVEDTYVYAPVTALLAHGVNVLVGVETWGEPSTGATAYAVRHEVVAVLGMLTVAAAGRLGALVTGRRDWGVVSAAALMAVPMWPGHSMFNIKDVPVGAGFTFFTLGLALLASGGRGGPARRAGPAALLVAGVLLAVGTRPGMWTGLAASAGIWVLVLAWRARADRADAWWRVGDLVVALVVAYGLLLAIYPAVFAHPADWLLGSALASSAYTGTGTWTSIPRGVVVGVPTLLLVLGVAGLLLGLRRRSGDAGGRVVLVLVASQALVMPLLAMAREAFLYNELRQVLFAAPASAVLLAVGMQRAWQAVSDDGSRVASRAVALASAAALAVPVAAQVQLFPYGYAYASVVVDAVGTGTSNDYWRTSQREIAPEVPAELFLVCSPVTDEEGRFLRTMHWAGRATAEAANDCRTDYLSPLAPYRELPADPLAPVGTTFAVTYELPTPLGTNCEQTGAVSRHRLWTEQTMTRLAVCDLVLPAYPSVAVAFDAEGLGGSFLLGGWTSTPAEEGIVLRDAAGSLGFTLPPELVGEPVTVSLQVQGPDPAGVRVNDVDLPVTELMDGVLTVRVPRGTAAALGEDRLVVTVLRAEPGTRVLQAALSSAPGR